MAGASPEETVRFPLLRQRWDSLLFLHWRYPPAEVQALLPASVEVEEIDGSAWIGMTPFLARRTRLAMLPPAPVWSDFPETNLRTYVRTGRGRSALWFLSIDAASAPVVAVARGALGVPYRWAPMDAEVGPRRCVYRLRRRRGSGSHHIEVEPGRALGPDEVSPRDHLLTGRWRAVVPRGGATFTVPVDHPPWPLYSARLVHLDQDLLQRAGLPAPAEQPEVLWSPGVDAALGAPRPG